MCDEIEVKERPGPKPAAAQFKVEVGDEQIEFRSVVLDDPVPTGRQLLDAASLRRVEEHLIFRVLENGLLEELRLDETTDLRERGTEKFITFRGDRSFRFVLDGRRFEWGAATVLGRTLKILAGVDPATHGVWLEQTGEPDRLLQNDEQVSLRDEAVERFRTGPVFSLCIEGEIYSWPQPRITTEQIAQLGGWDPSQGVIEIDQDQNERTLKPGEVIELKPGLAFGKKLCWRRGEK
jgi:hypothetical protein